VIEKIIKSIFGDPDTKKIKKYRKILEKIRKLEQDFSSYSLVDIQKRTSELKESFKEIDYNTPE